MSKDASLVSEYEYDRVPTKEKLQNEPEDPPPEYGRGVRHVQVLIMFMAISVAFIARGHLGVTIVAMTNAPETATTALPALENVTGLEITNNNNFTEHNKTSTGLEIMNNTFTEHNDTEVDMNVTRTNIAVNTNETEKGSWNIYRIYVWKKSVQELVLGGFFLGYCIMMFPIGLVCQRYGGKIPLQIALFMNAILSIATPWLAVWGGWKAVTAVRILQGMTQAGCFPSLHTLLSQWAPLTERARFTSYAFTGTTFGTVLAFQISGYLSASSWGWPSMFWFSGGLCLVMFVILTIFGAACPEDHKSISYEEKNFILGRISDGKKKVHVTPWRALLTSKHVWAIFAAHIGSLVSFVFFFTQVPSYLYYILHVNLKDNGMLSSLPYLVSIFSGIGCGILSDICTNNNWLSILNARRAFNFLGQLGPAICFAAVSYTHDTTTAVIVLIILLSTHVNMYTGWMINYLDLAPNFSGALMAAGNTLGNIFTVVMPPVAALIVTDVRDISQWRTMFFIMAGLCTFSSVAFAVFATSEKQWWNDVSTRNDDVEHSENEKLSKSLETKEDQK